MSRSVTAAALVRPAWSARGVRVEGPDEDAFTLAVAALDRLRHGVPDLLARLEHVELVGEFPSDAEAGIVESLGGESLDVRRHPPGVASLFQTLASAGSDSSEGAPAAAVVAVDTAGEPPSGSPDGPRGAAASAIAVGGGAGARILGQRSRHHPPERRPDAAAWVRAARGSAPGVTAQTEGILGLLAEAPPPVLLAHWREAFPKVRAEVRAVRLDGWGDLPTCRGALALAEHLRAARGDETVFLASVRKERTDFLALAASAEVRWLGDWDHAGPAIPAPHDAPFTTDAGSISAVSEGAYVPRATYQENLPSRWRLVAERCAGCGATTFPARGRCRTCGRDDGLAPVELPRDALEVEAVTTVAPGAQPTEFDSFVEAVGSYSVVLVRLADSVRATLQVTDAPPGSVRVGDRVGVTLRRLYPMEGAWRYGLKAVPSAPRGAPSPDGRDAGRGGSQVASSQLS